MARSSFRGCHSVAVCLFFGFVPTAVEPSCVMLALFDQVRMSCEEFLLKTSYHMLIEEMFYYMRPLTKFCGTIISYYMNCAQRNIHRLLFALLACSSICVLAGISFMFGHYEHWQWSVLLTCRRHVNILLIRRWNTSGTVNFFSSKNSGE